MLRVVLSIKSAIISHLQQLLLRLYLPHTCAHLPELPLPQPNSILFGIHLLDLLTALFCAHKSYKMKSAGHATPPKHNYRHFADFTGKQTLASSLPEQQVQM
jgi:hypothetical protein